MVQAKRYPKLPELLARLALASGVGYLAAAYTLSRWLTRPTPAKPRFTPRDGGLRCEVVQCRAADGVSLVGWSIEPAEARATIALFHGMRGNRERLLDRIGFLCGRGYRCVAIDHRAHGESGGRRTSFGFHESRDVDAVLELITARWPGQPRAALGISMGAAALCYAAPRARGWNAVILESCYEDIAQAFTSRLQNGYPPWYQRLSRGVVWVTERRLGIRLDDLAPVKYVADFAPAAVLVLTGTEDPHATPDNARKIFEQCRGHRDILLVPAAGHKDVFEKGGTLYQSRVAEFLSARLPA
jgi:alpha-beta hydrolase superfamily lysophospholipase